MVAKTRSGRAPLFMVLDLPPVASTPSRANLLGIGPRGGLGRRWRAQKGILAGVITNPGAWDGRESGRNPPSDGHGRTVEVEDAISHVRLNARCMSMSAPRHPEHSGRHGPLLVDARQLLIPEIFPRLWCLP